MNNTDNQIIAFIFKHPDIAAQLLEKHGYSVKKPLTLPHINEAVLKAVYDNPKEAFLKDFTQAMADDGYSNFVATAISVGLSVVSSILGSNQAKKARQLQEKLALANLANQQMLGEEQIRTTAETERTKILAQTLQQYRSDLQSQSTQRLKDTGIYVVMLGVSIGIVYGFSILLTSKDK